MDQKEKIKEDFKRLSLAIQRAVDADQIWRELGSPENHKAYSTQFNIYIPFFGATRDLALCQLLTFIARAYDKTSGSLNIQKLLERMKKADYCSHSVDDLLLLLESHAELWGKLRVLRNECIAHTSSNYSEKQAFQKAQIKNDEVSLAVAVARTILLEAADILSVDNSLISKGDWQVKEDCNKLLRNLKAGREARLKCGGVETEIT